MRPRGRAGDVVPQNLSPRELVELYGDDGFEVVAFQALMRRMREAEDARDFTEDGKLRVGDDFFEYATGDISGRELCERLQLLAPAPPAED